MENLSGDRVLEASIEAARKRRSAILDLKRSGKTLAEIGSMLGVTKQRISAILKKARDEVQ